MLGKKLRNPDASSGVISTNGVIQPEWKTRRSDSSALSVVICGNWNPSRKPTTKQNEY